MKFRYSAAFVALLVLGGCASHGKETVTPVSMLTAEEEVQTRVEIIPVTQVLRPMDELDVIFHIGALSDEAYRIQAGDQVSISFLTAPELSGTHLVLPDGTIEMPYAGTIHLKGLTLPETRNHMVEKYKSILRAPEVYVAVPSPMAQLENLRATLNHPGTGLSRTILVGADGRVTFPLIGSLSVVDKSIDELREEVNRRYASEAGQVKADVLLKTTAPNQVYVMGQVAQPGAYSVSRPVSVLEALALAQGHNSNARLDSAVIMRRQGDQALAYVYDVKKAMNGQADQMAYLQPDDLLFVPQTRLSKAGQISRQIADVILFQGVGFSFSYRVDNKESD